MSVKVPLATKPAIRRLARALCENPNYPVAANRLAPIARALKRVRNELISAGVDHVGIFGSTARGEDGVESDIDILIDFDTKQIGGLLGYVNVIEQIRKTIHREFPDIYIDVADYQTLKSHVRENAEAEVLYVF